MPEGPSQLSYVASAFYVFVVVACVTALCAASGKNWPNWHSRGWLCLVGLYAALVGFRVFELEENIRLSLREVLRVVGAYDGRAYVQLAVLSILAMVLITAILASFRKVLRRLRTRQDLCVILALVSGVGMAALILLRLISLHTIDWLLFGPLKLNWFADMGFSMIVTLAAFGYIFIWRDVRSS